MGGGGLNGISIKKREREGQSLSLTKGSVRRDHGTEGGPAPSTEDARQEGWGRVLQAKMVERSGHRERLQRSEVVVVASGPCLLLLRRRRKSVHHHARGDTLGEEITPSLKQEATVWCGGLR